MGLIRDGVTEGGDLCPNGKAESWGSSPPQRGLPEDETHWLDVTSVVMPQARYTTFYKCAHTFNLDASDDTTVHLIWQ